MTAGANPMALKRGIDSAFILLHERNISSMSDLLPLLPQVAGASAPVLIVTEDLEGEALATRLVNKLRGPLQAAAVQNPGFGDRREGLLEDIAVPAGGRAITADLGVTLAHITLADLGRAERVTIDKDYTTIVAGAGSAVSLRGRVTPLRAQVEAATSDYDREKLRERLPTLLGGVVIISVGAAIETEMKERERVDDAMHATKTAVEEGLVPGAGRVGTAAQAIAGLTLAATSR